MKRTAEFSYLPTLTVKRDAIACAAGTVTGTAMIAIPYNSWLELCGVVLLSYSLLAYAFKVAACLVCRLCSTLHNRWYSFIRLYKTWAFLATAITAVTYAQLKGEDSPMRMASMIMAASIIVLFQCVCVMHLTNRFVWEMYASRISASVMTQACFRALYDYAKGKQIVRVPFQAHGDTSIHGIHRILQSSLWGDVITLDDIWHMLVTKVKLESESSQHLSIGIVCSPPRTTYVSPLRRMMRGRSPMSTRNTSPLATSKCDSGAEGIQLGKLVHIVTPQLATALSKALGAEQAAPDSEITKEVFSEAVAKATESRVALKATLEDYVSIVSKLKAGFSILSALMLLIVWCIIAGVNLMSAGTTWLTFILAFSFCFGDTAKKMFEGLILVFVWQSYAVSDRVLLSDDTGEVVNLVVTKINLLTTEFLRSDGLVCVVSNSTIQQRDIRNLSRAKFNNTALAIKIAESMPSSALDELQVELEAYRTLAFLHKIKSVKVQMRSVKDNGLTSNVLVCLLHTRNFEDNDERYMIHDCFARKAHDFFSRKAVLEPQRLVLASS
jgi:small-conductance mechanosensitive channel